MNLLVLSGSQLIGPELSESKHYVGQLLRRLRLDGYAPRVDRYEALSLHDAGTLLARLPLYQYDFILLQLGDAELTRLAGPADSQPRSITSWVRRQWRSLQLRVSRGQMLPVPLIRQQLDTVLMLTQPYRANTLLLSPLPRATSQYAHRLMRRLFLKEARLWVIDSVDTTALLQPANLMVQPRNPQALNEIAHELLASELHTQLLERVSPPYPSHRRPSTQ